MDQKKFQKQLDFIIELDKLKSINRVTLLLDSSRNENSAEHSWHIALIAMILKEYSKEEINIFKVMKMLLIHDVVEIDAGDTFLYDKKGTEDKLEREGKAASRLFGLLPPEQAEEFKSLWQEFEKGESAESKFAKSVDRIQPMLHNYITKGVQWKKNKVTSRMVLEKNKIVNDGIPDLWEYMKVLIEDAVKKGYIEE
jgi:putative hydrolases of HD superfamily